MSEEFLDSALIFADIALYNDNQLSEAYSIKGYYYGRKGKNAHAVKINPSAGLKRS